MMDLEAEYGLARGGELLDRATGPVNGLDEEGLGTLLRYPPIADCLPQPPALCFENDWQPQYSASLCEMPVKLKPLHLPVVNGARLLGQGIVIARDDTILSESVGRHAERMGLEMTGDQVCRFSSKLKSTARHAQDATIPEHDCTGLMLFDPAIHRFGMWLLKCLPKLSVLPLLGDPEIKVVVPKSLPDTYLNMMLDLGIAADQIVFHDPLGMSRFRRLVIPPKMYTFTGYRYGNPFEVFRYDTNQEHESPSRLLVPGHARTHIYVSRRGNKRRRLANEIAVERLFAEFGFQIVETSVLTATERVSLFANCEFIAGAFGSGLYQLLFSRREIRALALIPPEEKFDKAFLTMGHVCTGKGGRVGYVFGRMLEEAGPRAREFDYSWEIDVDRLRHVLARLV